MSYIIHDQNCLDAVDTDFLHHNLAELVAKKQLNCRSELVIARSIALAHRTNLLRIKILKHEVSKTFCQLFR